MNDDRTKGHMLIAHVSDLHIVSPPALCYNQIDTRACLARVIARLNVLSPRPDVVVFTGDLVDEPSVAAYECLHNMLAVLNLPFILLPGNHDDRSLLAKVFAAHTYLPSGGQKTHFVVEVGDILLVGFDAVVPGREHAHVELEDLAWLDTTLSQRSPEKPVLLAMHHPPMHTGLAFMDEMQPPLPLAFEALLRRHDRIKLIICGHIHRAMDGMFAGIRVAAAPSTAHQFQFATDPMLPPRISMEPQQLRLHLFRDGVASSFSMPVADSAMVASFPGVDETTWPSMVKEMREGVSRNAVYRADTDELE